MTPDEKAAERTAAEAKAETVLTWDDDTMAYVYCVLYDSGLRLEAAVARLRRRGWR